MYYCDNCDSVFEELKQYKEIVTSDPYPMGFNYLACPYCKSEEVFDAIECSNCGEYIVGEYIKTCDNKCYCENCYEKHDTSDL